MTLITYTVISGLFFCVVQLLRTRYNALRRIPGPLVASFSNLWKVKAVYNEEMHTRDIAVHEKYGPVVRIGPNHVSVSSPESFYKVHASRTAFAKVVMCPPPSQEFKRRLLFILFFSFFRIHYNCNHSSSFLFVVSQNFIKSVLRNTMACNSTTSSPFATFIITQRFEKI